MKKYLFLSLILLIFASCEDRQDVIIMGMEPLYFEYDDFSNLRSEEPRNFGELGDIISVGNFLFINELYEGIHVIDNTDPENPIMVHFWRIDGCSTFTIDGTALYASNGRHLIVIDITNFDNITYVKHIVDFYLDSDVVGLVRPPATYTGFFYCVDPEKGIVYNWQTRELVNPLCETF